MYFQNVFSFQFLKNTSLNSTYKLQIRTRQKSSFASTLDFRSGIVEVCVPLGYGAASVGDRCPKFRDSLVVSSSRVKSPINVTGHMTLVEETARLSRNIGL